VLLVAEPNMMMADVYELWREAWLGVGKLWHMNGRKCSRNAFQVPGQVPGCRKMFPPKSHKLPLPKNRVSRPDSPVPFSWSRNPPIASLGSRPSLPAVPHLYTQQGSRARDLHILFHPGSQAIRSLPLGPEAITFPP
jgi:hypothetical protein